MESPDTRAHARRRKEQRLGILRRRATLGAALGFAAFLGLATQHAVGSAKHGATRSAVPRAATPNPYFDEQPSGFAFDDASVAPSASPIAPPVAQTNVS